MPAGIAWPNTFPSAAVSPGARNQAMSAVEKYYSVQECALLLSVSERTILRRIEDRELGEVVNLGADEGRGKDYRVPASGLNAYLHRRRVFTEDEPGIVARTVGELRRKSKGV